MFYDHLAQALHPNVVVLVVVSNDFANHSVLLESTRNGWSPEHVPRQFARRDSEDGKITLTEINPEWRRHRLGSPPVSPDAKRRARWHQRAVQASALYGWVHAKLTVLVPEVAAACQPRRGRTRGALRACGCARTSDATPRVGGIRRTQAST